MPELPSPLRATLWIVRYRLRALAGRARAHAFELLALAPLILGAALWVLHRMLGDLRPLLRHRLGDHPLGGPLETFALLLVLALTGLQLPAVWRELLARSPLSDACDASPTPPLARWYAALLAMVGRQLAAAGVIAFAALALADPTSRQDWPGWLASLLAMSLALALVQLVLGLVLVRFGLLTDGALLLLSLGLAALALLPHGSLLLFPWWPATSLLHGVLAQALGLGPPSHVAWWTWGALGLEALVLLPLGARLWLRWWRPLRASVDLARRPGPGLAGRFEAWLPHLVSGSTALRALVVRDLRLIWRRFSAAVPIALSTAALVWGAVLLGLIYGSPDGTGRRPLVIVGAGLVAVVVAALGPLLLAYQLPRLWMEKGSGVDFALLGKAKSTTTLLLVAPWLLSTAALPLIFGDPTTGAAWGTAGLAMLAGWMSSAMVAATVWEVASQPLLGLLLSALLGFAFAALLAFYPHAWWLWWVLHLWILGMVAGRAGRRVRFTEIEH